MLCRTRLDLEQKEKRMSRMYAVASLFGDLPEYCLGAQSLAARFKELPAWTLHVYCDASVPEKTLRDLQDAGATLHVASAGSCREDMHRQALRYRGFLDFLDTQTCVSAIDLDFKDHGKVLRLLHNAEELFATGFAGVLKPQPHWIHGSYVPYADGCVSMMRLPQSALEDIGFARGLEDALTTADVVFRPLNAKQRRGYGMDEVFISKVVRALEQRGVPVCCVSAAVRAGAATGRGTSPGASAGASAGASSGARERRGCVAETYLQLQLSHAKARGGPYVVG